MSQLDGQVLDAKQLSRIESVHRGFIYQHLYATGCLLSPSISAESIRIEGDEDIEIVGVHETIYVQVKTRSRPLVHSDIADALQQFETIRAEHESGRRPGAARFLCVTNAEPSSSLIGKLTTPQPPTDISVAWPNGTLGPEIAHLPPAWTDISSAATWCTHAAEALPHRLIASDSLIWKVASHVALAASGTAPYEEHSFQMDQLPALFEQIFDQLQDFPVPLQHYRPQDGEPVLVATAHVRVISGFSGAGKTSWASQAAVHSPVNCAYYDAADTPASALASALVRECAVQLAGSVELPLARLLAPGGTGLGSLRALDQAIGVSTILVIDNAHTVAATTLYEIAKATKYIDLVLLCHPVPSITELEALLAIQREELRGWSLESVAAEATALGCHGPIEAMDKLRVLAGGYPLYVQNASRLAATEYAGDVVQFCAFIQAGIHPTATAQEVILARVFDTLQSSEQSAIGLLSLADTPLTQSEASRLLGGCLSIEPVVVAALLRRLRYLGLLQLSGADRIRIHDAFRILGKNFQNACGADATRKGLEFLRDIVLASLSEERDSSRIGSLARVLASLNQLEPLIELIGEELFHEIGVIPEVTDALQRALALGELSPDQRFWAHDGLTFTALKHGGDGAQEMAANSLDAMEKLLADGALTPSQQGSLWMKRASYEAENNNIEGVNDALSKGWAVIPSDRAHVRIFLYNSAAALYKVGDYRVAEELTQSVVSEYYEVLKVTPDQVSESTQPELHQLLGGASTDISEVKHLADALELLSMIHAKQGQRIGFARIHAMRFYELVGAVDSVVRTGLDVTDAFVWIHDFDGALQVMEDHVLPYVQRHRLIGKLLDARSLYAVVLAYLQRFDEAELELERLGPLLIDAPDSLKTQIEGQRELVRKLRRNGVPPQRRLPLLRKGAAVSRSSGSDFGSKAPGRNDPCPCGSGKKFKKCHGA